MSAPLPGSRLGPYEIGPLIGAGGMGEVFRAVDTRLGRTVALKLLPEAFAAEPERLARFEREARLLASVNHPNIAQLYGFEAIAREGGGQTHVIAMELVEGEGLSDLMARGPVPPAEAIAIARQIAEALEAAHEKGVVHRDLKPANVRMTPGGDVKILDFGLAKAWAGDASTQGSDLSQSPTLVQSGTAVGVILGTAGYMSPEQARGRAVDKKTDIWAFGVVLWEMLTGRRLFTGETVTDVLAAVLTRDVDWSGVPASTPDELLHLLRRCLERNPKMRLHDIADARIALAELERGAGASSSAVSGRRARTDAARRGPGALGWAGLAALAILAGVAAVRLLPREPASLPHYTRLTNDSGAVYSARFTKDGATVVYGEASGGAPVALHSTPAKSGAPRRFDLPGADVVGISANGQMALLLGRHHAGSWLRIGTLAQASLGGDAPRALLENVYDADISSDGTRFAVVRDEGGGQRLEYPIGTTLTKAEGWIDHPRISKDGRSIAFADHPLRGDDQGYVAVVAAGGGEARRLSPLVNFLHGIAWSPDGREVWATSGEIDRGTTLTAFDLGGKSRALVNSVGLVFIHDVTEDGRVLLGSESLQVTVHGRLAGSPEGGDSFGTWFGESFQGISDDGRLFVGSSGSLARGSEYQIFYRLADASAAVNLGDGYALGGSPDGKWVFAMAASGNRAMLRAEPTGPGEPRRFDLGTVEIVPGASERVTATTDGTRVAFLGATKSSSQRGYVFDLGGKAPPRAVTTDGVRAVLIAPGGEALVAVEPSGVARVFPTDGSPARSVPGAKPGEFPVAWASSGKALFVWDRTLPARVVRVDLETGARSPAFEWTPRDEAGALYGLLVVSTDAKYYLMRYRTARSSLAVMTGVR